MDKLMFSFFRTSSADVLSAISPKGPRMHVSDRGNHCLPITATLAILLALVLGVAAPSLAHGYHFGDYGASGVRIRTQPDTSAAVVGLGYPGDLNCHDYGTITGPNDGHRWIYNVDLDTNKSGWSATDLIVTTATHCA